MADQEHERETALPPWQLPFGHQAVAKLHSDMAGQVDARGRQGFAKV